MPKVQLLIDGIEQYSENLEPDAELVAERDLLLEENEKLRQENEKLREGVQDLDDAIDDLLGDDSPGDWIPDGAIVLTPDDLVQYYIEDGAEIYFREGTYNQNIDLAGGIENIKLLPHPENTKPVTFSGLFSVDWSWRLADGVQSAFYPGIADLLYWQDDRSEGSFNNTKMYPVLATIGDEPLLWQPAGPSALEEGEFYIDAAPTEEGTIYVKLKPDQSIEDFQVATFSFLLRGDEDNADITIKGINFKGCSNTGKSGAVNFPGVRWTVEDVTVDLTNTIGIEFGQGGDMSNMKSVNYDSTFTRVVSKRAGQMGVWGSAENTTLIDCGHEGSNWKGFDQWWESSNKFEEFKNCIIRGWFARDCRGPGLWFDIGNTGNKIYDPVIDNCLLAGIFLEAGSSDNEIYDPIIHKISHEIINPGTPWNVRAGILIQAGSNGNKIFNPNISDVEDCIRINNEDARGVSDFNEIIGCILNDYSYDVNIRGDKLSNITC